MCRHHACIQALWTVAVQVQARQMPHLLPHHPAPGTEWQGGQRGAADAGAEEDMGHGVLVRDLQPVWQEGAYPEGQTGPPRWAACRWEAAVSTPAATRMQLSYTKLQVSSRQPVSSSNGRLPAPERCSPAGCVAQMRLLRPALPCCCCCTHSTTGPVPWFLHDSGWQPAQRSRVQQAHAAGAARPRRSSSGTAAAAAPGLSTAAAAPSSRASAAADAEGITNRSSSRRGRCKRHARIRGR